MVQKSYLVHVAMAFTIAHGFSYSLEEETLFILLNSEVNFIRIDFVLTC